MDLLKYKKNIYSQNGEDGIIEAIFNMIGNGNKLFCEFGAWDGIHLSNVRNLVISKNWSGIMIEGDEEKFKELSRNYEKCDKVYYVNKYVDAGENSLDSILHLTPLSDKKLDFLSIDIDGLDYEILENLKIRPRVICIEVNAGHNPNCRKRIERDLAKDNIGQSLGFFSEIASSMGYGLVCYTGNAFFVRKEEIVKCNLREISCENAYTFFLEHLTQRGQEWLFLVNSGWVNPYYLFNNPFLTGDNLHISNLRRIFLKLKSLPTYIKANCMQ